MKVEVFVLGSPSLISLMVSVDESNTESVSTRLVPNRRSSEIQGTALDKCVRAWTCIYRSMPAGIAQPVPNKPYGFCGR